MVFDASEYAANNKQATLHSAPPLLSFNSSLLYILLLNFSNNKVACRRASTAIEVLLLTGSPGFDGGSVDTNNSLNASQESYLTRRLLNFTPTPYLLFRRDLSQTLR